MPAETIEQRYDGLRSRLQINILGIDQELISMPPLVQEAAELAADANDNEHASRLALDVVMAEAAARLREPVEGQKAKSETQIGSELILQEDVQQARTAYDLSRLSSSRCSAMLSSMRDKSRLLGKTCEMIVAGFVTPSSYSPGRRQLFRPPSEDSGKK